MSDAHQLPTAESNGSRDRQLAIDLTRRKIDNLFRTILLTTQVWLSLFKLLLMKLKEGSASATLLPTCPAGSALSVDETFLIFGVQEQVVLAAVVLNQLTTADTLHRNMSGCNVENVRWSENVKLLLQAQHLSPDFIEMLLPKPSIIQQFGSLALDCIGG